jgi:hypothetical protein
MRIYYSPIHIESVDYVWRETLGDGFIAVRSFQTEVKEKREKDLKDERFDFDKVVSENLLTTVDKYMPKAVVYHEGFGYLIVKKWDDVKKIYVCRVKN